MSAVVPPQIQAIFKVKLPTTCFCCDVFFNSSYAML